MGHVGTYSTTRCAVCVRYMHKTGLRVDVIGFLSPINILSCSIIAVTDSGGGTLLPYLLISDPLLKG